MDGNNLEQTAENANINNSQQTPQEAQTSSNFDFLFNNGVDTNPTDLGISPEDSAKFNQVLEKFSKGKLKKLEDVGSYLQTSDEYSKLRPQFEQMQQELKKPRYANELSQKFDELVGKGATHDELKMFFELQTFDLEKMSNMDLVKHHLLRQQSQLTQEDVQQILEETYGGLEPADLSGPKKLKLLQDAQAAKEFLQSQKAKAENPERLQQNNDAQQKQQEVLQKFSTDLSRGLLEKGTYQFDFGKEGGTYDLPLKGKDAKENAAIQQQVESISAHVGQMVIQNGINLQTTEGKAFFKEQLENAFFFAFGKKMFSDIAKIAAQSTTKKLKTEQHNVAPITSNNMPKITETKEMTSFEKGKSEAWKKMMGIK